VLQKCALHQGGVNLPKWGWEQGEVTCNPNIDDPNNLWNLETIRDNRRMLCLHQSAT
jgi:dolichyl-phosphate-mannose--protein O-mannosyl transferase